MTDNGLAATINLGKVPGMARPGFTSPKLLQAVYQFVAFYA